MSIFNYKEQPGYLTRLKELVGFSTLIAAGGLSAMILVYRLAEHVYIGIIGVGAVLALLLSLLSLRAKARHHRAVRLIEQTPVTTIVDLVQASSTAHADPSTRTHAAVQGRVVAKETTRLTAPITGSSCVAYKVWVFDDNQGEAADDDFIKDSKWGVRWAVDDGTGLALVVPSNPWHWHLVEPWRFVSGWPGMESSEDTFANTPTLLAITRI